MQLLHIFRYILELFIKVICIFNNKKSQFYLSKINRVFVFANLSKCNRITLVDMIRIYLEDISTIDSKAKFDAYFDKLPKYRQDKINSLKNENDKYLSLLAGRLLCDGLRDLGLFSYIDKVVIDENGKPSIPGTPIYFSISHSGTKAMVVFSDSEVGCDVQVMKEDSISLADRFFTDEEQKEIDSSEEPVKTFFKLWTLKECYMKASGKGLALGLKNINVYNKDYISKSYTVDQKYMVSYIVKDN